MDRFITVPDPPGTTWSYSYFVESSDLIQNLYSFPFAALTRGRFALLYRRSSTFHIIRSLDGGATWEEMPLPSRISGMQYDPVGDRLWSTYSGGGAFISDDFGGTWRQLPRPHVEIDGETRYIYPDLSCVGPDGYLYCCADIYVGNAWYLVLARYDASGSYTVLSIVPWDRIGTPYYSIAVTDRYRYLAEFDDINGIVRLYELDGSWQPTLVAERVVGYWSRYTPLHLSVDPITGNALFTGADGALLFRRAAGTLEWFLTDHTNVAGVFTADGRMLVTSCDGFFLHLRLYDSDGSLLHYSRLSRAGSGDESKHRAFVPRTLPPGAMTSFAYLHRVGTKYELRILLDDIVHGAPVGDGEVIHLPIAGAATMGGRPLLAVGRGANQKGEVYAAYTQSTGAHVLRSLDGGATWEHAAALPSLTEPDWLVRDPASGRLWLGSARSPAIYTSGDRGITWTSIPLLMNGGMPLVSPYVPVVLPDGALYMLVRGSVLRYLPDGSGEVLAQVPALAADDACLGIAGAHRYALVYTDRLSLYALNGAWQPTLLAESAAPRAAMPPGVSVSPDTGDLFGGAVVYRAADRTLSLYSPYADLAWLASGLSADGMLALGASGETASGNILVRLAIHHASDLAEWLTSQHEIALAQGVTVDGVSIPTQIPWGAPPVLGYSAGGNIYLWFPLGIPRRDIPGGTPPPGAGQPGFGGDIAELILLQLIWQG